MDITMGTAVYAMDASMDTTMQTTVTITAHIANTNVLGSNGSIHRSDFNQGRGGGHYVGYRQRRCHEHCHDHRLWRHSSHGYAAIGNSVDSAIINIVDAAMDSIMRKAMKAQYISGQASFPLIL